MSQGALKVRTEINNGSSVYRAGEFGRSNTSSAQFWAPEHPFNSGFSNRYGVDSNKIDYIIGGRIPEGTPYITRPAPGLGNNKGGAMEAVTDPNTVKLDFFHMP